MQHAKFVTELFLKKNKHWPTHPSIHPKRGMLTGVFLGSAASDNLLPYEYP